jgi:hypothetical protein
MNLTAPAALDAVLRHPGIWRRSAAETQVIRTLSTGLAELDALLPGGGWPCGALSEILIEHDGLGELTLLMPALAELTRRRQRVVFVTPPYIPYAPALQAHGLDLRYVVQIEASTAEGAWSAEQCLRSGSCGAVLGWLHQGSFAPPQRHVREGLVGSAARPARVRPGSAETTYTQLRRLQLAAESGDALAFLFRPASAETQSSPAALRVRLRVEAGEVDIDVLKCRGSLDLRRSRRTRLRRGPEPALA